MFSEPVISARNLGKCYHLYANPKDRLKQFLWRGRRPYYREFWALRDASFDIMPGEVVGIIGRNGSGKSTLLQLVCGTLMPTVGEVAVKGRLAALLELGAGFNPEFTGRENVFMSAAIMGMSEDEIKACYDEIVEFSGIGDFIDQPVKTYSSGMYVRLAFSVAVSYCPNILVIDEALSVGDGEFSRKSFDRIMALKNQGRTILFCSHSLYQVEALCSRALWLHDGRLVMQGDSAKVIDAYRAYIDSGQQLQSAPQPSANPQSASLDRSGVARIVSIEVDVDGKVGPQLQAVSGESDLCVTVSFNCDLELPAPVVALGIETSTGQIVTSAFTNLDGFTIERDRDGQGTVTLRFRRFPLLKGSYWLGVVLMCENGIHFYDTAPRVAEIIVGQANLSQGIVSLPHEWS